jgi:hypothetical protein
MSIDKNINSHFEGINKDAVGSDSNPAPVPTAMVGIVGYDNIEWGDRAKALAEAVANGDDFDLCSLINEIRNDCIFQIKAQKEEGEEFQYIQAILFDKFLAVIKPMQFGNSQDKDSFMEAISVITEKVKEDFGANPILTFSYGEAWTLGVRKSFGKRLGKIAENKEAMARMVQATVDEFGGISGVPEDHPALLRFDIMMFLCQFNTNKGYASIFNTVPMDESVISKLHDGALAIPRDHLVEAESSARIEGRMVVDTKGYPKLKFDGSKFDGERTEM